MNILLRFHRIHCFLQNLCYNVIAHGAIRSGKENESMTDEFDIDQEDAAIKMAFQEMSHKQIPPLSENEAFFENPLYLEEDSFTPDESPILPKEDSFIPDEEPSTPDEEPYRTKSSRKPIIIIVSIISAVLLALISLIIGLIVFSGRDNEDDRILENVYAAGIELSGMTVEEATKALQLATEESFRKDMVIHVYQDTLLLSPEDTNASLDVDAVAQAAYNYGRSGTHAENQQIRKNAHKRSYTVPLLPYLNLDITMIQSTVHDYCTSTNSIYAEPVITLEGERPTYDPDKSAKHQILKITLGTPMIQLDANDLYEQVLECYSVNELLLEYDAPEILWPATVNAQDLFSQYCTPAQDAVLDPTTYSITQEIYGYGFDLADLQQKLDDARHGETIEITFAFLEPTVLAQDISDGLYLETLSTYQSDRVSSDTNRNTNLQLSCNAINGYVIKPGETFSFKQVLGPISKETGYTEALICSVNGTAMGGGISQTASALYYCALHANLDIIEHHNHDYATDFIELGLDAYVDGDSRDLRLRNNTAAPIRINATFSNSSVKISLEGAQKPTYFVSIRTEITDKDQPTTTYQMLLPNNKYGYKNGDVIVTGVEGYQVKVSKEITNIITGNQLSLTPVGVSEYQKRDEIIAQIGTPVEEPQPTEPTTETPTVQ